MSNGVNDGVDHTVTQGGIKIVRHLEANGRGIVGTVELTSQTVGPTLVEVTQRIPADLSVESMAFKPDASPEFKNISGNIMTLRQTVEDEPVQLVFGIMLTEPTDDLAFAPPTIEAADPVGATRSPSKTADTEGELEVDIDPEFADEEEPVDADADLDESSPTTSPETSAAAADGEPALEVGESTESDDPAADGATRRSVELRVDRLSARVEEFATYAEALESFIDENGTAPEFVDRVEARVDDIDARVTATREDLDDEVTALGDELETEVADLRGELSAETDDLRGELETTRSEVTALRDDLDTLREDVTALREEVATLSDDVEELTGMRESLATALSDGPLAEPPATGDAGDD